MVNYRIAAGLLIIGLLIFLSMGWLFSSDIGLILNGNDWDITDEGILTYSFSIPKYDMSSPEKDGNTTLSRVRFLSRGEQIAGLLRMPGQRQKAGIQNRSIPGIVLLPGATVTKEREQGLAKHLADLGYATITIDQRNLGMVDAKGDLEMFIKGIEPVEHRMVYDALAAAEILRSHPGIDTGRIIYVGESNGGRFAIIACALDAKARGVLAISTCGYGTDAAIVSAGLTDRDTIRFYRSIDPESYLGKIPPRSLVMIHSLNDTVIPYQNAAQTYALGFQPKAFHTVGCSRHGYCTEMNHFIEKELKNL
jgi:dienelactone hydrolase